MIDESSGLFSVLCCGRRRGLMPGGALVCSRCDFDHPKATVMPNEHAVRDVPPGVVLWRVTGR